MNSNIVFIFFIFYLQSVVICENNKVKINSGKEDVFVPTHEWQVIKEGQSIPEGLHIRINLQTGVKEAKLLDPAERTSTATISHKVEHNNTNAVAEVLELQLPTDKEKEEIKETNTNSYSPEELKKFLQNIKNDENLPPTDKNEEIRVKQKFKNFEQLKKELGDLNMSVKSDAEILRDLFKNFNDVISSKSLNSDEKDTEILAILVNFEYLVHQIDNANEFINLNGFNEIIYKNLNSTNTKIVSETLNILGSCIQNNAKAQINALEAGAFDTILRLIATDSSDDIKMRALYSLGSLLRRFPVAQKQFLKNDGLNIFAKMFTKPENMKLQLRVVTLIYDLLVEQQESLADKNGDRLKQYKDVDFKNTLIKNDWCPIFKNVLINNAKIEHKDHDAIERCLNVMIYVTDNCLITFHNKNLLITLQEFHENYKILSAEETLDDPDSFLYFTHLKNLTHNLLSIVSSVKTEL